MASNCSTTLVCLMQRHTALRKCTRSTELKPERLGGRAGLSKATDDCTSSWLLQCQNTTSRIQVVIIVFSCSSTCCSTANHWGIGPIDHQPARLAPHGDLCVLGQVPGYRQGLQHRCRGCLSEADA